MGRRLALVELGDRGFLNGNLTEIFGSLNLLGAISDFRDGKNLNGSWMSLYSNNFSIKRDAFLRTDGFSIAFGEQWGYEDLEFGIRLSRNNVSFHMTYEYPVFHQPHLEQSRSEQPLALTNATLFVKLHPFAEVELLAAFGTEIQHHIDLLRNLSYDYAPIDEHDIVLGLPTLYSGVREYGPNHFLGVYLRHIPENAHRRVALAKTFFELSLDLQLAVLSEATRIAPEVYTSELSRLEKQGVVQVAKILGLNLEWHRKNGRDFIRVVSKSSASVLRILLPPPIEPRKRIFWLLLSLFLGRLGYQVELKELRGTEDFTEVLWDFSDSEKQALEMMRKRSLPFCSAVWLASLDTLKGDLRIPQAVMLGIEDTGSIESTSHNKANIPFLGDHLLFNQSLVNLVLDRQVQTTSSSRVLLHTNRYSCAMFSGYFEDGIGDIISSFENLHQESGGPLLSIFLFSWDTAASRCYTRHNETSRANHLGAQKRKYDFDLLKLKDRVNASDKSASIDIRILPGTLTSEICDGFELFVCATSFRILPFEVLLFIARNIPVLLPQHVALPPGDYLNVATFLTESCSIAERFEVPCRSSLLGYTAWRPVDSARLFDSSTLVHDRFTTRGMASQKASLKGLIDFVTQFQNDPHPPTR